MGADTTLADIFGVDYNARGQLVARDGAAIDAPALLQEMLGVIAEFGGEQLKSLTDPAKWLDQLKAGLDLGEDALSSFARSHGLQDEAPEEAKSGTVTVQQGNDAKPATLPAATEERAFGFNALSLPNLFATLFNRDKQAEVVALASNLKQNLTADLLNMKEQTFDFLRNSGHLQGDGDMHVSLGNYNFNWGRRQGSGGLPRRQQQLLGWPRGRCLLRHRDLQHLHRRCRSGHRDHDGPGEHDVRRAG